MTEAEMCTTFRHFVRLGVEEAMPDVFSTRSLIEAQMYADQHPEFFTMERLRDVIQFIQDKHPARWQSYLRDVTHNQGPGPYRMTDQDGHVIWEDRT